MAISAIANGGKLMEPILVKRVLDGAGNTVREVTPKVRREAVPANVAKQVNLVGPSPPVPPRAKVCDANRSARAMCPPSAPGPCSPVGIPAAKAYGAASACRSRRLRLWSSRSLH